MSDWLTRRWKSTLEGVVDPMTLGNTSDDPQMRWDLDRDVKPCIKLALAEIDRLKAEVARLTKERDEARKAATVMPSRVALVCVRDAMAHLFEDGDDAREFLVSAEDDWSFAAWTVGVVWHPVRPGGDAASTAEDFVRNAPEVTDPTLLEILGGMADRGCDPGDGAAKEVHT